MSRHIGRFFMLISDEKLSAFDNAIEFLLSVTSSTCQKVANTSELLRNVATLINKAKASGHLIHIVGMGRSFRAGMAFGELLKDKGFQVSYPGKTLARPIQKGDIVFAVSGSGWTSSTLYYVEASILRGTKIVSLVGHERSKLGRLSDVIIKIPGLQEVPKDQSYIMKQLSGKRSPLAPMGTVSELSACLVGIGLACTIDCGDTIERDFIRITDQIVKKAQEIHRKLKADPSNIKAILTIYRNLTANHLPHRPYAFFLGAGLSGLVAHMAAMRFQHLGVKVRQTYDWRFREANDVVTILSGSGETRMMLDYADLAKKTNMKLISITAFPDSQLVQKSDHVLVIDGRTTRFSQFDERVHEVEFFIPTFEFITAIILDSIVAQIAFDLEIDEDSMRAEHANIQ